MLSPLPRQDRWSLFARASPSSSAFPLTTTGRLLHCRFRGLLSVHLRYGLHARQVAIATLSIEGFSGFVTSTAASTATGRSEPVPGRDLHPLKTNAFSRRTWQVGNTQVNAPNEFRLVLARYQSTSWNRSRSRP